MRNTALVTGASGGIGLELARIFAARKTNLVLVARNKKRLVEIADNLRSQYRIQVYAIPLDLSTRDASLQLHEAVVGKGLTIHYLINNAGFGCFGQFLETSWDKEEAMLSLNVSTLTHLTKLFLPGMVKRGKGRILNVSSTAAFQPGPLMAVYYATKAYVLSFSEAIANELKGTGITVTVLCPGPTLSGFQKAAVMEDSRLVRGKKLSTAEAVAQYGYDAMMLGKTVAIHGGRNWILANASRVLPRSLVTAIVRRLSEVA
jgi:short-subunit dehydrogenase